MPIQTVLISAATATTNPAPTGLSTTNPYGTYPEIPSSAWVSQSATKCKALVPYVKNVQGDGDGVLRTIPIALKPSGGAAVTYTVTLWRWVQSSGYWAKPSSASESCTGNTWTRVECPGDEPLWIELSSISTGAIEISYDMTECKAI